MRMAQRKIYIGSEGPFLFDDESLRADGTAMQGYETEHDVKARNIIADQIQTINSSTDRKLVMDDEDKHLAEVADLSEFILGTADEIDVTDPGDGTVIIKLAQAVIDAIAAASGGGTTPAPAAPALTLTPATTSIELAWTFPAGAAGVKLYRALVAGGPYEALVELFGEAVSFLDEGLENATDYYYVSKALTDVGIHSALPSAEASATTLQGFLSIVSPSFTRAFSFRKLDPDYAGSCIKVRRDSDDTTLDIGFVNDVLDVASLLAFVGSASGYIDTWYDFAGLGNAVQATLTAQPRIVNAGVLDVDANGLPTAVFSGAQRLNYGTAKLAFPVNALVVGSRGLMYAPISTSNNWGPNNYGFQPQDGAAFSDPNFYLNVGSGGLSSNGPSTRRTKGVLMSNLAVDTALFLGTFCTNSSGASPDFAIRRNGVDLGGSYSGSYTGAIVYQGADNGYIGWAGNSFHSGNISEVLLYNLDLSAGGTLSGVEANVMNFYGL